MCIVCGTKYLCLWDIGPRGSARKSTRIMIGARKTNKKKTRNSHSGSKAQDRGDTRSHVL